MPALVDRQILAPVIRDPAIGYRAAGIERVDLIGAAAERRLQSRLREIAVRPVGFRQHGHLANDLRQFAVISRFQREADAALAGFLELGHIAVIGAVARVPLLAQRVEGPDDVLGGHRRAVVKARALAQRVDNRQLVGREVDRLGGEPVFAAGLVFRRRRQCVEDAADAGGRQALDDIRVEGVVGADRGEFHRPAFWGVRIDVVEILEVRPVFQFAE